MVRTTEQARARNRARLLESAAVAFARDGLDRANINEISLASGLAKGTVYNYFASKEALFLAVVEQACEWAAGHAADPGPAAPVRERLRALIASDMAWAAEHEAFARVLVRELFAGQPEMYARVVEAAAPFIGQVDAVLRDAVARGEVRADMPSGEMALVFSGLGMLGLAQHWGSGGGWPALEEIPGFVVDLFLDGARTRDDQSAGDQAAGDQTAGDQAAVVNDAETS